MRVPVSVLVMTKNEAARLPVCLAALTDFDEVIVVDSASRDATVEVAQAAGVPVVPFQWSGHYPKKRQWCLDHLSLKHDWVFFVDADEIVLPELAEVIRRVVDGAPHEAGFFVIGRYRIGQKILRYGVPNAKIALFHKQRMMFPVVDDLAIPGMGEIEGHYQPVLRPEFSQGRIGCLPSYLIHDAFDDMRAWLFRHEKYARWEAGMNRAGVWPVDPVVWRQRVKVFLRSSPFRAHISFLAGYILKGGFLDGREGLMMARLRYRYHRMIAKFAS